MSKSRILFILKRREDFNASVHTKIGLTTGLYNSASFVNQMMEDNGFESKLVVVTDNNDIDREVNLFKPTHCIIEAVWVVPSKFQVLQKLHPSVKWIIRIHSEMPFMANEGIALGWFGDYAKFENVILAPNSPRMYEEIKAFVQLTNNFSLDQLNKKVVYLPNYYPQEYKRHSYINKNDEYIDIGCFGAIRPLKNHLLQAVVALVFAENIGKKLRFHINAGRMEMKGEPVLHNLQGVFEHTYSKGHRLISHDWTDRDGFLQVCAQMDIGMQVSFSETFNIVGADFLSQGVPLVGSSEIPWIAKTASADPVDSKSMLSTLTRTYNYPSVNLLLNRKNLNNYCNNTKTVWKRYFNEQI
jgi:hypothetical protein